VFSLVFTGASPAAVYYLLHNKKHPLRHQPVFRHRSGVAAASAGRCGSHQISFKPTGKRVLKTLKDSLPRGRDCVNASCSTYGRAGEDFGKPHDSDPLAWGGRGLALGLALKALLYTADKSSRNLKLGVRIHVMTVGVSGGSLARPQSMNLVFTLSRNRQPQEMPERFFVSGKSTTCSARSCHFHPANKNLRWMRADFGGGLFGGRPMANQPGALSFLLQESGLLSVPCIRRQQTISASHHSPVILVSSSTKQAYLIMMTVGIDAWPGESMRANLSEKPS
jgi:hypothetical protein